MRQREEEMDRGSVYQLMENVNIFKWRFVLLFTGIKWFVHWPHLQ